MPKLKRRDGVVSVATAILIRRNLKRHWGRLVTLGILTLLAAAVANLALIVATDYNPNFDHVIVDTLQNFGVKATVAHIVVGPSVIQFQIELAPGIKVSKVAGLANDLTMALAVVSVRVEAPILGQHYVGIEIPNPKRKGIALRSVMESEEFQQGEFLLPLPMGMRVDSRYLVCGLEDMPHLLVAGTTESAVDRKSVV